MQPSGLIFYKDEYETQYKVVWNTINNVIDMTTYILQPYQYTEPQEGYVNNRIMFRKGIITVTRQAFKPVGSSYEIIAEGSEQYVDFIQINYPCGSGPTDQFKYHFNSSVNDQTHIKITDGSRWADPDDLDDESAVWADLDTNGDPIIPGTMADNILAWTDVWAN